MSTPSNRGEGQQSAGGPNGDEDRDRRRAAGWYTGSLVAGLLAALLAIGTTVGIVQAVSSDGTDRVVPSTTAPVYGAR